MRNAIRFIARLYPKRWRTRYGDEFTALIEDSSATWRTLADVLQGAIKMQATHWGFLRITTVAAFLGLTTALGIAFSLPEHWISHAVISIESEKPQVAGWEVSEVLDRVESRSVLTAVINNCGLYRDERRRMPMEDVIERMKRAIRIAAIRDLDNQTAAFGIDFDYPDRDVAQGVVSDLVLRIIDENLRLASKNAEAQQLAGAREPWVRLRVIDPATLPARPTGPSLATFGGAGLATGALAGILLALAMRLRRKSNGICPTCGRPFTLTA